MPTIERDPSTDGALAAKSSVPAALGTEVVVEMGFAAVFAQNGRVVGVLGPGRFVLDPSAVPFATLLGSAPGEACFVAASPVSAVKFGGALGAVIDAEQRVTVTPRLVGEATIRVVDPARAVQAALSEPNADLDTTLRAYVTYSVTRAVSAALAGAARSTPLASLVTSAESLAPAAQQFASGELANVGLAIDRFSMLSLTLSDEDSQKLGIGGAAGAPPTYEMLWDCKFCGEKKLLGLTHRHCPSCGAPQNAEDRYFPSDAEKVPAKNHVYFGADVKCPACGEANSRNSKHCGNCGGPLEGTLRDIGRRRDEVVAEGESFAGQSALDVKRERVAAAARAGAPAAKPRSTGRVVAIGCVSVVVLVIGVVAALFLVKKESGFRVTGHSWKREIAIERFGPVSDSAWCDQMPAGAMGVSRHRDVRSHKQVPDGEDCHTRKVDNGNGTFSEHRECTPKFRDEPVYDERCTFSVDRWAKGRTATATGASASDAPSWPSTNVTRTGTCVGCEREAARSETYTVTLVDDSGGTHSCDVDPAKWTTLADGTTWKGAVRLVGGLDCTSLSR